MACIGINKVITCYSDGFTKEVDVLIIGSLVYQHRVIVIGNIYTCLDGWKITWNINNLAKTKCLDE